MATTKHDRRFLRYSLRALLLLVLLAAIPMAWLAKVRRDYHAEQEAIGAINAAFPPGVGVGLYGRPMIDIGSNIGGEPSGWILTDSECPSWLAPAVEYVESPIFERARSGSLSSTFDDAVIPYLGQLEHLKRLQLWGTDISPRGVKTLREKLPECDVRVIEIE